MQAKYTPVPGLANCPHCDEETGPLPIARTGVEWVAVRFRCPTCGRTWNEMRDADGATRYWTPAAAAEGVPG
jgi:transposase-like protein